MNSPKQIQEDAFEVPASTTAILRTKELTEQFTQEPIFDFASCQAGNAPQEKDTGAHYRFQLSVPVTQADLERGYAVANLDPYRIADCYGITNHAIFSALKKLLVAGGRGFKDAAQDVADSIGALQRWQEMQEEQATLAKMVGKSLKVQTITEQSKTSSAANNFGSQKDSIVVDGYSFGNSKESTDLKEALKTKKLGDYE